MSGRTGKKTKPHSTWVCACGIRLTKRAMECPWCGRSQTEVEYSEQTFKKLASLPGKAPDVSDPADDDL